MEEYVLDQKACAEVALYMYEQYKIAPSQRFMYLQFDEWLRKLIKTDLSNTPAPHLHEDDE
jgi:hypothetical protein